MRGLSSTMGITPMIAVFGLVGPATALSSETVDTFEVTATDFTPTGAPTDPVIGSITLTFDPTFAVSSQQATAISLTIDGVSFAPSNVFFSVSPTDCGVIACAGGDAIKITGSESSVAFSYFFDINSAQQIDLVRTPFTYEVGGTSYMSEKGAGTTIVGGVVGVVSAPEPGSLALLGLGFVGLALARSKQFIKRTVPSMRYRRTQPIISSRAACRKS